MRTLPAGDRPLALDGEARRGADQGRHPEYNPARADLNTWMKGSAPADLCRRSNGTKWTNEELLFRMVLGYMVVRTLLPLVHLISRLPQPVGKAFAALLNAGTRPSTSLILGLPRRSSLLQQATNGPETL